MLQRKEFSALKFIPLIALIGAGERIEFPNRLIDEIEQSNVTHMPIDFWIDALAGQPVPVMKNIFRGLIILEKNLNGIGGSVASNIWVLKAIDRYIPDNELIDLISWALENKSQNPYTPFGTHSGDEEYLDFLKVYRVENRPGLLRRYSSHRNDIYARNERMLDQREKLAKQAKEERRLKRQLDAAARRDKYREVNFIRRELINDLSNKKLHERLAWLANTELPLASLPADLFEPDQASVDLLDAYDKLKLLRKVAKHKGKWLKIHRTIINFTIRSA